MKPVECVFDAHFLCPGALGSQVGNLCAQGKNQWMAHHPHNEAATVSIKFKIFLYTSSRNITKYSPSKMPALKMLCEALGGRELYES